MKTQIIPAALLLAFSFLAYSQSAYGADWNKDLSKMMDGLEKEVGPGAPPGSPHTPTKPQAPPQELPQAPSSHPDKMPGSDQIDNTFKNLPADQDNQLPVEPKETSIAPQQPLKPNHTAQENPINTDIKKPTIDRNQVLSNLMKLEDNYLGSIAKNGLTRWESKNMPVKIYIENSSKAKGFSQDFPLLLKNAFQSWADQSKNHIKIEFTKSDNLAQIVCRWTDDKNVLMSPLEGGNTVIVPDEEGILGVDMKILTLPPPNAPKASNQYISRVALHEAGHALGLTGHSPVREDVMYNTVYAGEQASLTARDINSMNELYSLDEETIASIKLDQAEALKQLPEEFQNPQVNAVRLSNEAARAMKSNKYDVAIKKLEEAHKLDPENKLISTNLGAAYANFGSIAGMTFNIAGAAEYFKKSIPLLEAGSNKTALIEVLTNYIKVLKMLNRQTESKKMQDKLTSITSH